MPKVKERCEKKHIDRETFERLASMGLTVKQIAGFFDMNERSMYYRMQSDPTLRETLERGRSKGVAWMAAQLWKAAENGDTKAITFWLKAKGGFIEQTKVDVSNSDGSLQPKGGIAALIDEINTRLGGGSVAAQTAVNTALVQAIPEVLDADDDRDDE